MGKFFYVLAQVSGLIFGTGPLWLFLGVCVNDLGLFFHYWIIAMLVSIITFFVSIVLMQMVE